MTHPVLLRIAFYAMTAVVLSGCANSASHQVMKKEYAGDDYLTCKEIDRQKRKARIVIRGVEQDKEDMTGDDVVDGILWFPFNVIAKQSNYSSATNAAENRIEHLTLLEVEKGCRAGLAASGPSSISYAADLEVTNQLHQLNSLYRTGVLTKEEYITKKKVILDNVGTSQPPQQSIGSTGHPEQYSDDYPLRQTPSENGVKQARLEESGKHLYQAEKLAEGTECNEVSFMIKDYSKDVYSAKCSNGLQVISCEWGECAFIK
ncbi:SHOCT domain-containing protein [Sedimenticola hydrogenitrophicus]|uniref:SHOCT domain-containing protein n=1 Tax=Sedimenticola hydrogenitrophicus TaxID=2967975 RepID=UPI0021A8E341|nr:SHOCT domain-containing protein [Sedimenticola hydrogenitrophicus]